MSSPAPIRVLIADDHPIVRDGLRRLLEAEPGFVVVGEAEDGQKAISLARSIQHDVLLLDLAMPVANGLEVLRTLHADGIQVRTVLLTASIESSVMTEALRLGAVAVLLKTTATELLFECLRSVMAGHYWVGREAVLSLVEALANAPAPGVATPPKPFGLTQRELEVVQLVAEGYSNKDIAGRLAIREDTVKHHLSHAFDKTGTSSRVELALFAVHHKIAG
jgi:two-component system nitrate/nitrite response regulator NarL